MVGRITGLRQPAAIRPEALRIATEGRLQARVTGLSFMGLATRVSLDADGTRLTVLLGRDDPRPADGQEVALDWNPDDLHLMQSGG